MARMGDVWDRTTEVLSGRGGMLAGIAALTLFLPGVIRDVIASAVPVTPAAAIVGGLIGLAVVLVSIWGQLAILAASSHPHTTRADAFRQATQRLAPDLGVTAVLAIALVALLMPAVVLAAGTGIDWSQMAGGTMQMTAEQAGRLGPATLYLIVLFVALLFVGARLVLVNPTVLHERRGLGAIARSWQLTRGMTWRILGVLLLFLIVLGVVTIAAQAVFGIVFRLLLGPESPTMVALLTLIVMRAISAGFAVLAGVFTAQLYVAVAGLPERR